MKVYVTKLDIERGKPGESDSCPLALALRRKTGIKDAWVGCWGAGLGPLGLVESESLTRQAQSFVRRFDSLNGRWRKTIKPGWVEVWK